MPYDRILLEHGGGGLLSNELIAGTFLPLLKNPLLEPLEDGAVFEAGGAKFCFTTDSFVVQPRSSRRGHRIPGRSRDSQRSGHVRRDPLALSAGFIWRRDSPWRSWSGSSDPLPKRRKAGVAVVTGDTKVVPHGAADGLFINTSGIGIVRYGSALSVRSIHPGDAVLLSGPIGEHGAAILSARSELGLVSEVLSDSAPLNSLVERILAASPNIHCMRDATRGGLGAILAEIAGQSAMRITIREASIPIREEVRGICEIFGFDPLFLANEGRMALFCPEEDAEKVLAAMQGHDLGREACRIGTVARHQRGGLVLETVIGGSREIDLPTGELVPRIC
jgi:hydrogenase expression/formation protein HypE